ncbi:hypothetical protein BC629DRAFT_200689 [Irpex lacteus]|nr:hypothetical protein BC629DRAFT_200689 [Irpex lacteus]
MLGSPEWETRVKVRMDRAIRKSRSQRSSVEVPSRAVSPSTATRSQFNSSHRSRDTSVGYKSSRHAPSSTSSKSRAMSHSFLEMYSPDSNVASHGASHASSPPFLDSLPQLPSFSESNRSGTASSRSRGQTSVASLSPTLMQMIEPVVASWQDDTFKPERSQSTGGTTRSRSHSPTPPFQTPPTTPAKSSNGTLDPASRSSRSGDDSSRSTLSISRSISTAPLPRDSLPHTTTVAPTKLEMEKAGKTSPKPSTVALSSTTRPLNIENTRVASIHSDTDYFSVIPAKYIAERSVADRTKSQRRKSGSPSIGPSPLRNPVTSSSSSSLSNAKPNLASRKTEESYISSTPSIPDPSWELDDLMKNGRLDIDAVTEALGLGFSVNDNPSPASASRSRSPVYVTSLSESFRKPGGPLCAIPEEPDMDDSVIDENARPLSSLLERWGRIQQKFTAETAGEVRESVSSSILEVDLSLLGIDVSAISGIGTPVMLTRADGSYRDTMYTIEALDVDEDSSSGWLEDSNQ